MSCRARGGTLRTSSRDVTFKIHGLSGGECKGPPLRANSGLAFGATGHRNFLQRLVRVSSVSNELHLDSATGSAGHFVVGSATPKRTGSAPSLETMSSTRSNTVQTRIQPVRFAPTSLNSRACCVQRADAPRRPRVPKGIRHATSLTAGAQPAPRAPKRGRREVASSAEKSSAVSWKSLLRADQRRCHTQT